MVNQEIFTRMIKDKGKEAITKNLFIRLKDNRIKIRTDLAREHSEELSKFNGKLPLLLHIPQDMDYLKKTGAIEQYHKELKEEREKVKQLNSDKQIEYYLESFAEWVVENPKYSYLFDYVEFKDYILIDDSNIKYDKPKIPKFEDL